MDMDIVFALYAGTNGDPAQASDSEIYANHLLTKGWTKNSELPVLADGTRSLVGVTPMTQNVHPELCALTPDMSIISCYFGHGKIDLALEDIRAHAAAASE